MNVHMGLQNFVTQISNMRGWPHRQMGPGHFGIEVMLPATRRSQVVHAMLGQDPDNVEMVYFWSDVCPMSHAGDPWMLLQESTQVSYGCYAVKDGNVIVKTSRVAEYLDAEEMLRVIFYVGRTADEMEQRLLGVHYDQN